MTKQGHVTTHPDETQLVTLEVHIEARTGAQIG